MSRPFFALSAAALLGATGASAATFDFAADAQTKKDLLGYETPFTGMSVDGITVTASTDPGSIVWSDGAHDGRLGHAPASGLGACEIADCNGRWEDGIENDESITLAFDRIVRLTSLFLRESSNDNAAGLAADHTTYSGAFTVNGVPFAAIDGLGAVGLTGDTFTFQPQGDWNGERASGYLSAATVAPVPLPATAMLLIGGLAGLGMIRRGRSGSEPLRV